MLLPPVSPSFNLDKKKKISLACLFRGDMQGKGDGYFSVVLLEGAECMNLNRKDPPWYTYIVRNSMASLCIGTALGLS